MWSTRYFGRGRRGKGRIFKGFNYLSLPKKHTNMDLRYPIGPFSLPDHAEAAANRLTYVKAIGRLPKDLAAAALQLKEKGLLDTPYRPEGWTGRQVIHHVADSHVNAYVRHKRILTEDHPNITPYDEQRWAVLPDVAAVPVAASLELLQHLHLRLATLLATCTNDQWERTAYHAGSGWTYRLDTLAANYAWHGQHHLGHLRLILDQA